MILPVQRFLSLLLVLACTLALAACHAPEGSSSPPPPSGDVLSFPLIISGEAPDNLDRVQDRLNGYVQEKVGAAIRFVPVQIDTLENFYLLQKSSAQVTDFLCLMPAGTLLSTMVEAGLVIPLDDLLEQYGKGILDAAADILEVGSLGGTQYMIPEVKDVYTMGTSLEFNAALVRKYGFSIAGIRTIRDVEPMLEVIARQEPDVIPLTAGNQTLGYTGLLGGYDELGNSLGVLNLRAGPQRTVVNWFETPQFRDLVLLMRSWYQKGYIHPDALVRQRSGTQLLLSGEAFCNIGTIMPTGDQGTDLDNPSGLVEVQLSDQPQLLNSYSAGLEGVCISAFCPCPDKAMRFLELLYTDPYVVNLLEYGLEGENYTLTDDGLVDNGGSNFLMFGQPLNQTLRRNNLSTGADYLETCRQFAAGDVVSPAFGFVFDTSPVTRETALCQAVVDEYLPVIDCGCVDPDTEIPRFTAALREAGIDTIVAEKQRQLDLWAAAQP